MVLVSTATVVIYWLLLACMLTYLQLIGSDFISYILNHFYVIVSIGL